eukprot:gene14222-biopygen6564
MVPRPVPANGQPRMLHNAILRSGARHGHPTGKTHLSASAGICVAVARLSTQFSGHFELKMHPEPETSTCPRVRVDGLPPDVRAGSMVHLFRSDRRGAKEPPVAGRRQLWLVLRYVRTRGGGGGGGRPAPPAGRAAHVSVWFGGLWAALLTVAAGAAAPAAAAAAAGGNRWTLVGAAGPPRPPGLRDPRASETPGPPRPPGLRSPRASEAPV